MSERNENSRLPESQKAQTPAKKAPKKKAKKRSGAFGRFLRRTLLVVFTLVLLAAVGLAMFMHTVFTGPSDTARNVLTITLSQYSATQWIPGVFLEEAQVSEILGSPLPYADLTRMPDFWPFPTAEEG